MMLMLDTASVISLLEFYSAMNSIGRTSLLDQVEIIAQNREGEGRFCVNGKKVGAGNNYLEIGKPFV